MSKFARRRVVVAWYRSVQHCNLTSPLSSTIGDGGDCYLVNMPRGREIGAKIAVFFVCLLSVVWVVVCKPCLWWSELVYFLLLPILFLFLWWTSFFKINHCVFGVSNIEAHALRGFLSAFVWFNRFFDIFSLTCYFSFLSKEKRWGSLSVHLSIFKMWRVWVELFAAIAGRVSFFSLSRRALTARNTMRWGSIVLIMQRKVSCIHSPALPGLDPQIPSQLLPTSETLHHPTCTLTCTYPQRSGPLNLPYGQGTKQDFSRVILPKMM